MNMKGQKQMLELSELMTGKQGKELEKLLIDYEDVSLKSKDLEKVKKVLVTRIKEICDHAGTYETKNLAFEMKEMQGRVSIEDMEKFRLECPNEYNAYTKRGDNYLQMGKIAHKGKRV